MKKLIILFVLSLLILLPAFAHEETDGGELKFVKDYTIEMQVENNTLSFSIQQNGTVLKPLADLEIYKNGNLDFSQKNIQPEDDGHYVVQYSMSGSFHEIRPFFHIGNDTISAQFSHGEPQKSSAYLWIIIIPLIGIVVGVARKSKVLVAGCIVLIIILGGLYAYSTPETTKVHEHADFAVFLDGQQYNFSQERFMTFNNTELSELVHMHDMKGNIIHKHAKGVTIGYFFGTLGMKFNSTCFIGDGTSYCDNGNKTLKMYVNGQPNYQFNNYEPNDLDRILLTYSDEAGTQIASQISSVSDEACIQSGKCPGRGTAPEESCSAGKCE